VPCCGFSSMLFASQRHECNLFLVWVCVGLCCTVPSSINAMMCSSPAYLREKKEIFFFFEKQWLLEEDFATEFGQNWQLTRSRFLSKGI
jgi:hypothetical protein